MEVQKAKDIFETLINYIYPLKCIFCKSLLKVNKRVAVCDICRSQLPFFSDEVLCNSIGLKRTYIVFYYSGCIERAIKEFKFYDKPGYAKTFAHLVMEKFEKLTIENNFDIIVPVPLHPKKKRSRGYNQAELLGHCLAKMLKLKFTAKSIMRVRNTKPQSFLKKEERIKNMRGVFAINNKDLIRSKDVLLIDDIMTTGSTLNQCAKVLLDSGANSVSALVLASGRRSFSNN